VPIEARLQGFRELLRWFRDSCRAEIPRRIHQPVVSRAPVQASHTTADGAPAWSAAFEGYLAGNPYERDADGSYRRPLEAALATLAKAHPEAGDRLAVLARNDADWAKAAEALGWDRDLGRFYFEAALWRLWGIWREESS
jgi:hypothetical protein